MPGKYIKLADRHGKRKSKKRGRPPSAKPLAFHVESTSEEIPAAEASGDDAGPSEGDSLLGEAPVLDEAPNPELEALADEAAANAAGAEGPGIGHNQGPTIEVDAAPGPHPDQMAVMFRFFFRGVFEAASKKWGCMPLMEQEEIELSAATASVLDVYGVMDLADPKQRALARLGTAVIATAGVRMMMTAMQRQPFRATAAPKPKAEPAADHQDDAPLRPSQGNINLMN